jgi:regulator of sirC expression with transglutaminase-like and TPR domain
MEGFHYDHSESAATKVENQTIKGLLDTKMGTCETLPILYLAIAQRLGYPVYAVSAPDHQFLRYVDPNLKMQNIEATSGGGYSPDEAYIRNFQVNEKALKSGAYMRTMTYREYLGFMLGEIAITSYRKNHDLDRMIHYFEMVEKIDPTYPDNYVSLKMAYIAKSRKANAELAEQYRQKAFKYSMKADELGYIKLPPQHALNTGVNQ